MAPSFNYTAIAAKILSELPPRDREALRRFYLLEQSPQQIQESLDIDAVEFQVIKSGARTQFFAIISGRSTTE